MSQSRNCFPRGSNLPVELPIPSIKQTWNSRTKVLLRGLCTPASTATIAPSSIHRSEPSFQLFITPSQSASWFSNIRSDLRPFTVKILPFLRNVYSPILVTSHSRSVNRRQKLQDAWSVLITVPWAFESAKSHGMYQSLQLVDPKLDNLLGSAQSPNSWASLFCVSSRRLHLLLPFLWNLPASLPEDSAISTAQAIRTSRKLSDTQAFFSLFKFLVIGIEVCMCINRNTIIQSWYSFLNFGDQRSIINDWVCPSTVHQQEQQVTLLSSPNVSTVAVYSLPREFNLSFLPRGENQRRGILHHIYILSNNQLHCFVFLRVFRGSNSPLSPAFSWSSWRILTW